MSRSNGFFVTFEGIDGSGKSSQVKAVSDALSKRNCKIKTTFEPGYSKLGKSLSQFIFDPVYKLDYKTEIFLFMADRNEHCMKHIKPWLEEFDFVVSDRYFDSTLAYQGGYANSNLDELEWIKQWANHNIPKPQLTIWLDLPVSLAMKRIYARNQENPRSPIKYKYEKEEFLTKVRANYQKLEQQEPARIKRVDASGDFEDTTKEIIKLISTHTDSILSSGIAKHNVH